MFLAHFEGSGVLRWLEEPIEVIEYWHTQAVKVHNYLHDPDAKK